MKKNIIRCIITAVVLSTAWPAITTPPNANQVPLQKAVEAGIRQDFELQNRELDRKIAAIDKDKASKKKRFALTAEGSYLFKSDKMELRLPIGDFLPTSPIKEIRQSIGTNHTYDLKFAATQPLFTGGVLSNTVKLQELKELSEYDRKKIRKLEITGQIKASYFTYRLLERKKKSTLLLIENLKLHEIRLKRFYKEELVRKSDLLETAIKITEAEMKLEDLERTMADERITFSRLCPFKIDTIEKNYDESVTNLDESLAYFKKYHPLLANINRKKQMQLIKKNIVKGKYMPQVGSFAELHYGRPGLDFFKDEWSLYFQGGIGVKLTVFDWNERKKEYRIADLFIEKLENQKNEIIADVRKKLAQLYQYKISTEKQLTSVKKLATLANEDANLKKDLYKENQLPNIDYLSALITKDRYNTIQSELELQIRLINLNINTLSGKTK